MRLRAAILLALIFGGTASGATASPAQQLADRSSTFLERVLHQPVEKRTLVFTQQMEAETALGLSPGSVLAEYRHTPHIYMLPWLHRGLTHRASADAGLAGRILVHEQLHQPKCLAARPGDPPGLARALEEGLTEAVAQDVLPAWFRRFAPTQDATMWAWGYDDEVERIRTLSRKVTGSRTWRTRAARIWRKDTLFLPCAQRWVVLDQAIGRFG